MIHLQKKRLPKWNCNWIQLWWLSLKNKWKVFNSEFSKNKIIKINQLKVLETKKLKQNKVFWKMKFETKSKKAFKEFR